MDNLVNRKTLLLASSLVGVIMFVIGYATNNWMKYSLQLPRGQTKKVNVGLWNRCENGVCRRFSLKDHIELEGKYNVLMLML